MRTPRCLANAEWEAGFYHCTSRVVDRQFIFGALEKQHFLHLMRGCETFCGVQILTFSIMDNHFHILLKVPRRPLEAEMLPSDKELVRRVREGASADTAATLKQDLERFRTKGQNDAAEALREGFFSRMWNVSAFMKMLKQGFTQWYNQCYDRKGTLWEDRFHSALIEGDGSSLATVASYIDLNPIRAGIVENPADYRWCGYGEAMAGNGQAKLGLRVVVEALVREPVDLERTMSEYRTYLYCAGEEREPGYSAEGYCPGRRGFTHEEVEAMLKSGGKIKLAEALRCRVRYFCDGQVLGSRAFVDAFFCSHRARFGLRRKTGARPLSGIEAGDLCALRALRVRTMGYSRGQSAPPIAASRFEGEPASI